MIQKWKRISALVAVLGLSVAGLTACAGNSGPTKTSTSASTSTAAPVATNPSFASGTTMAKLAAKKTVNIGVDFSQPPFGTKELDGTMQGFDIDLSRYIAGALGIPAKKINWVEVTPNNRETYLEQGKVDFVMAAYAIVPALQTVVGFAGPYLVGADTFLVKKGNPEHLSIADPDSFAGKKLCGPIGGNQDPLMTAQFPKAQLVTFDVLTKCVAALEDGQVDAFGGGNAVLAGQVGLAPTQLELLPGTFGPPAYYGVGIQKADRPFCEFIDSTLKKAESTGYYKNSWTSIFGPLLNPAGTKHPTPVPKLALQSCSTTAP